MMFRNWPGVCFPNDCGENGHVTDKQSVCSAYVFCSSDASGSRQQASSFSCRQSTSIWNPILYMSVVNSSPVTFRINLKTFLSL